jgi:hypothetical protein
MGRPKSETAIAELARSQVEKHKLVEKLGSIGARRDEYGQVDVDQQLRAIQLLLSYGYGPPRAEVEGSDRVVIQVVYAETNQITIDGAAPGAETGDSAGEAVQRGLLRPPMGQDSAGNGSPDSSGSAG